MRAAVARLLRVPESTLTFTPQSGGVSSDIWRVDGPHGTCCAKRALPRLKVAGDWRAPTRRNAEEAKWLRFAAIVAPEQVPRVLAEDADEGVLLLSWFDPAEWRNWKTELLAGRVDMKVARDLGALLGDVHAVSARQSTVARDFSNLELFEALRLQPYFATAAERQPTAATALHRVIDQLRARERALVHGDVSPKNVLMSNARRPVLLDAECATWGDPTFDVSFLLSHLMLKAVYRRERRDAYLAAARVFHAAHATRAGELIDATPLVTSALLLARIDGKSPVEYLEAPAAEHVRRVAIAMLASPPRDVDALLDTWASSLATP
jgi:5-methylthioribose kinase